MELRDNQKEFEANIREKLKKGYKRLLCVAPTGYGKGVSMSKIASDTISKGNKCLIIVDRSEIAQGSDGNGGTVGKLNEFEIDAPVVQQTKYPPTSSSCTIAMIQTLKNRLGKDWHWDEWFNNHSVIIIDEAHEGIFDFIFDFVKNNQIVLGFTGSPFRSGKMRQFGTMYQDIVIGAKIPELIIENFLAKPIYLKIETGEDFSNLKGKQTTHGWDYSDKAVFDIFDKRQLYSGIVDNWKKYALTRHTIVYAQTVMHAARLAKEFNESGIIAKFIDGGKTSPKESDGTEKGDAKYYLDKKDFDEYSLLKKLYSGYRENIFKDFELKKYHVLINVAIATKGYDCPSIDAVILAYKTLSLTKYIQTVGRGARICGDKKDFLIMDFGQNVDYFGLWEEDREISLWFDTKEGGGAMPTKLCGGIEYDTRSWTKEKIDQWKIKCDERGNLPCGANIPVSATICPLCGYIIERPKTEIKAELIMVKSEPVKTIKEMTIQEIIEYTKKTKKHINWGFRQIYYRFGNKGVEQACRYLNYDLGRIKYLGFIK